MRSLILALGLLSLLGCSSRGNEGQSSPPPDSVLIFEATMRMERPENQIEVHSALPVITQERVSVELRDVHYGNASVIKIVGKDKMWKIELSGNKHLTSKPFSISTMTDRREIQIKATRTEKQTGERQVVDTAKCALRTQANPACEGPRGLQGPRGCGFGPQVIFGTQKVSSVFRDSEVQYILEISDEDGKFATVTGVPIVSSVMIKTVSETCR